MSFKLPLQGATCFLSHSDAERVKALLESLGCLTEKKTEVDGLAYLPLFMRHSVGVYA